MADNWQLKAVLSAVDNMSPVLKNIGNVAKTARKYLSDVGGAAGNLSGKIGMPMAAISGILSGFSLVAVKNAVVGFTDMGEAVQKGALKAGMSVEQYQRMKYVAEQSGTSIEAMEGSLSKLNRSMGDAAIGKNEKLASLMSHLGLSLRDSNGQLRTGVDLLPQLADAFKRNENPVVQARMGMAMFGKSYAEILPLLAEGAAGINDNLARFDKIKGVLGKDDIKGAKDLGDSFKDLEMVMKGFQVTIAKQLVPVIKPMVDSLVAWWVINKKLIGSEVSAMAKDLGIWIKSIDFKKVLTDVGDFVKSLGGFIDAVGGAKNALIGLVVFLNMQTIMAVAGLIGALARAGLAFLAMAAQAYIASNASLLSLLRIGAVALFTAGPIGVLGAAFGWLAGLAAGAGGIISGAMGVVSIAIRGVGAALMANPLGIILALATAAYLIYQNWDTLKRWFSSFFDWIGQKFQAIIGWAVDLAKSVGGFFGGNAQVAVAATSATQNSQTKSATAQDQTQPATQLAAARNPQILPAVQFAAAQNTNVPNAVMGVGAQPNGIRQPLIGPAQQQVGGKFTFDFQNAPPGMRMTAQETKGKTDVDVNMGYRSFATGAP